MTLVLILAIWGFVGGMVILYYQGCYATLDQGIDMVLWRKNAKQILFMVFIHGPVAWILGLIAMTVLIISWCTSYVLHKL